MTAVSSPMVTGTLRVNFAPCVDELCFLDGHGASRLVREVPAGAAVVLDIGRATAVVSEMWLLVAALRPAGSVEVVGESEQGIREVVTTLRRAFMRGAA